MSWEEEQRARNDVLAGRRDYLAGPAYQDAHRSASISGAEGAIAGGLIGAILGLLVMAAVGVAHVLGLLLRQWFLAIGSVWKKSPPLALVIAVAPFVLIGAIVLINQMAHRAEIADRAERIARADAEVVSSKEFVKATAKYGSPEAKRIAYMRMGVARLPVVSRKYVGFGFESWWKDSQYKDDRAFLSKVAEEECSTLYTRETNPSAEQCQEEMNSTGSLSQKTLGAFNEYIERDAAKRRETVRYWQNYEKGLL